MCLSFTFYAENHPCAKHLFLQANCFTTTATLSTRNIFTPEIFYNRNLFFAHHLHLLHLFTADTFHTKQVPFPETMTTREAFYTKTFDTMFHQNPITVHHNFYIPHCSPEISAPALSYTKLSHTIIQTHTHQNPLSQQKPL